jgi:hypothetical protein
MSIKWFVFRKVKTNRDEGSIFLTFVHHNILFV